jgi:hypothetical protein
MYLRVQNAQSKFQSAIAENREYSFVPRKVIDAEQFCRGTASDGTARPEKVWMN